MPLRRLFGLLAPLPLLAAILATGAVAQPVATVPAGAPAPDDTDPADRIGSWTAVDGQITRETPGSPSRTIVDDLRAPASAPHKTAARPDPPRDSR